MKIKIAGMTRSTETLSSSRNGLTLKKTFWHKNIILSFFSTNFFIIDFRNFLMTITQNRLNFNALFLTLQYQSDILLC
jgi:hypothetical protein